MTNELITSYRETLLTYGRNAIAAWRLFLAENNIHSMVLFTGRHAADRCGIVQQLEADSPNVRFVRFSAIDPEPDMTCVRAMTDFLKNHAALPVAALGGGSVMDAAKAAYFSAQSGCDVSELFGSGVCTALAAGREMQRVICLPTTSGTGSEATPYANIVDREAQVKKLIADPILIPRHSFVRTDFAATMPPHVRLATGCDALAHLLEGFLNVGADDNDPLANDRALVGIHLIRKHLMQPGGDEAIALASALGGMVIRHKSTGLPHLCSFSWFGRIEHGIAAAMLLPESWRYYLGNPRVRTRTMQLTDCFPGETAEEVIDSYRAFLSELHVPEQLRFYSDITPELLERTALSAGANRMKLELAPRPVPLEESYTVLKKILDRSY